MSEFHILSVYSTEEESVRFFFTLSKPSWCYHCLITFTFECSLTVVSFTIRLRLPSAVTACWLGSLSGSVCCDTGPCWTLSSGRKRTLFCRSPTSSSVPETMEQQRTSSTWTVCRSWVSPGPGLQSDNWSILFDWWAEADSVCVEGVASETENHEKKEILVLVEKGRWDEDQLMQSWFWRLFFTVAFVSPSGLSICRASDAQISLCGTRISSEQQAEKETLWESSSWAETTSPSSWTAASPSSLSTVRMRRNAV